MNNIGYLYLGLFGIILLIFFIWFTLVYIIVNKYCEDQAIKTLNG